MSSPYNLPTNLARPGLMDSWKIWDNLEQVTLVSVRPSAGGNQQDSPIFARRFKVTQAERAASGGAYTSLDRVWRVPVELVTVGAIEPGDQVVDPQGVIWTVLEAELCVAQTRWRLTCRDLVISHNLGAFLDVYTAIDSQDAAAGRIPNFVIKYKNIQCRFQEITEDTADLMGRRGPVRKFTVFVATRLFLTHEDQVRDKQGNIYSFKGYTDPDRIDELQKLQVELLP